MPNVPSSRKKRPAYGFTGQLATWYATKRSILAFVGRFAGWLLLFTLLTLTPAYKAILDFEVLWSAKLAHGVLCFLGGDTAMVSGATLYRGESMILEVKSKCSGLFFCWVFCSAVLAFPVRSWVRLCGAMVGSVILLTLNIARVVSLFLVGSYYPGWFTSVHEQFWPVFSLLITVVLLGAWLFCIKGFIAKEEEYVR